VAGGTWDHGSSRSMVGLDGRRIFRAIQLWASHPARPRTRNAVSWHGLYTSYPPRSFLGLIAACSSSPAASAHSNSEAGQSTP